MLNWSRSATTGGTAILALTFAASISPLTAHKGATGVVMERMMAMDEMGEAMRALKKVFADKKSFDARETARLAAALREHAVEITNLFPKGSLQKPTDARPEIWKKWSEFEASANTLAKLASDLEAKAAIGRPDAETVFAQIGENCAACHKTFRVNKPKKKRRR